jgi:hypothetical protein
MNKKEIKKTRSLKLISYLPFFDTKTPGQNPKTLKEKKRKKDFITHIGLL